LSVVVAAQQTQMQLQPDQDAKRKLISLQCSARWRAVSGVHPHRVDESSAALLIVLKLIPRGAAWAEQNHIIVAQAVGNLLHGALKRSG
jgi:hypothetical protein